MINIPIHETDQSVVVRHIQEEDLPKIADLSQKCFGSSMSLKLEHLKSQLEIFPEGQICVEYQGQIVGSASSLIVNFSDYGYDHDYEEISDEGFIRNHNASGVNLYGIEVGVDPQFRGMKIGRHLYNGRKQVCKDLNLQSIIIGGRIPHYYRYADKMTADEYAFKVIKGEIYDPVMTFQVKNGFVLNQVIPNYLAGDDESLQYATSMEWINDDYKKQ
ncbi:MAG TPA: GNAT family N-acetyltransferase [Bacillota bacterium]|nr:GNAT family N-acetyltransferase [Bacillota bacterium]